MSVVRVVSVVSVVSAVRVVSAVSVDVVGVVGVLSAVSVTSSEARPSVATIDCAHILARPLALASKVATLLGVRVRVRGYG